MKSNLINEAGLKQTFGLTSNAFYVVRMLLRIIEIRRYLPSDNISVLNSGLFRVPMSCCIRTIKPSITTQSVNFNFYSNLIPNFRFASQELRTLSSLLRLKFR